MRKNQTIQKSQRYSSTYSTSSSNINEIITLIQQNNKKQLSIIQEKITHFLQALSEDIARQTERLVQATQRLDKNTAWQMLMTVAFCLSEINQDDFALNIYDHPQLKNTTAAQLAKAHCLRKIGKHHHALTIYNKPHVRNNSPFQIAKGCCLQEINRHSEALLVYQQP